MWPAPWRSACQQTATGAGRKTSKGGGRMQEGELTADGLGGGGRVDAVMGRAHEPSDEIDEVPQSYRIAVQDHEQEKESE